MKLRYSIVLAILILAALVNFGRAQTVRYHTAILDSQGKILPWFSPAANAYDNYLTQLWSYIATVPNGPSSSLPMYFLYCGFRPGTPITADTWMNDISERLPNWVENARLYYAYSGNVGPLDRARALADYSLAHGMTPSTYLWPNFPYTSANAGETEFRTFTSTGRFRVDDVHTDLAGDMAVAFYQLYLFYGDSKYLSAAINVADVLAGKVRIGNETQSPWPYVVNSNTGSILSDYSANYFGCIKLFDYLIDANLGNMAAYSAARASVVEWLFRYPMQNGKWVDGHSDTYITGNTNLSNTCKSNASLYLFDHPGFDPNFATDIPKLLTWTEVNFGTLQYGAITVAEQIAYKEIMGYQTARQAAEYALWYAESGDETYRDLAYRGLNWSTYMMQANGQSSDGLNDSVGFWWSDCYGEGPRMFYYAMRAVPEWAPPRATHILHSSSVLKAVSYLDGAVQYSPTDGAGTEYLRLAFFPGLITVGAEPLAQLDELTAEGYTLDDLGGGDYALTIRRAHSGAVLINEGSGSAPTVETAAAANPNPVTSVSTNLSVLGADDAGEPSLLYTWSLSSGPSGGTATFSNNGTNAAKLSIATFNKAGSYTLLATITNADKLTATSSVVVTVNQSLTSISVSPVNASLTVGGTQQFSASAIDQFGASLSVIFNWSVSGGGTISGSGLFSATTSGGPFTVTAVSGGKFGTAQLVVSAPPVNDTVNFEAETSQKTLSGTATVAAKATASGGLYVGYLGNGNNNWERFDSINVNGGNYTLTVWYASAGNRTYFIQVNGGSSITMSNLNSGGWNRWASASTTITLNPGINTLRFYNNSAYAPDLDRIRLTRIGGSTNLAPTIATPAAASPNPVSGRATNLSVLGADDGGEAALTYTWAATSAPTGGSVSFSINGSNAAKTTTATFSRAGTYTLRATLADSAGLTVTSSASVLVNQTLSSITLSPLSVSLSPGATQQFTASALDQFGATMSATYLWNVSGGGTINSSGLFTAGATVGGPHTVTVTSGALSASATITITASSPTLGNTSVGPVNDVSGANDLNCWRFQSASSFTATSMRIYLANAVVGRVKLAIYTDNLGSPGNLLQTTVEVTNPGSGWLTLNLANSLGISAGTYYWLAAWSNASYAPRQTTTGGTARYITRTYGTWPNVLTGTFGPYTGNVSIYAF